MNSKMNTYCFQVYCRVGGGRAVVKAPTKREAQVVYGYNCFFDNRAETDPSKMIRSYRLIGINGKQTKTPGKLIMVPTT